jgi:preprotein translocase subunit YajC
MIFPPAFAQDGTAAAPGIESFLPLILILGVFYLLLIRPQMKKQRQHKSMVANLKRGDRVVTGGGLIGTVERVTDQELVLRIAENVRVQVVKGTLASVLEKPVKGGKDEAGDTSGAAKSGGGLSRLLGSFTSGGAKKDAQPDNKQPDNKKNHGKSDGKKKNKRADNAKSDEQPDDNKNDKEPDDKQD